MALLDQQFEFALNMARLILFIAERGYRCSGGEWWRTPEMATLYAKQGKGIVNSLHRKRLAVDINLFKGNKFLSETESYREIGEYWESLHPLNRWGGRFQDGNHFEMKEEG